MLGCSFSRKAIKGVMQGRPERKADCAIVHPRNGGDHRMPGINVDDNDISISATSAASSTHRWNRRSWRV
jgi:hypothetical protein